MDTAYCLVLTSAHGTGVKLNFQDETFNSTILHRAVAFGFKR